MLAGLVPVELDVLGVLAAGAALPPPVPPELLVEAGAGAIVGVDVLDFDFDESESFRASDL